MEKTGFKGLWLAVACLVTGLFMLAAHADQVEKQMFLVVGEDEVIASNARLGRSDELKLSAGEKIVHHEVSNAVAVVVTNQRFAACGVSPLGWKTERIHANEDMESVEVEDHVATVVTNDRILTFSGKSGTWSDTRR